MLTQLAEPILRLTVQVHPTQRGGTVEMEPILQIGMETYRIQQIGMVATQVIHCQDN